MCRTRVLVLALALLTLLAAPASAVDSWTSSGPTGGPIRAMLVDPSAPTTIYVGTLGRGVFKTIDGGDTWTQMDPMGLIATRTVRALVRDALTGTLYAGTEDAVDAASGGVFQSIDQGTTWTPMDAGLANKKVQALALDGTTLYAGTREEGECSGQPPQPLTCVEGGVFRWDGMSWARINTGLVEEQSEDCNSCPRRVQVLAVGAPGTLYAGTLGAGVYKSTDEGDTWHAINTGFRGNPECLDDSGESGPGSTGQEILALYVDLDQPEETVYAGATGTRPHTQPCEAVAAGGVFNAGFYRYRGSQGEWDLRMEDLPSPLRIWSILKRGGAIYLGTEAGVYWDDNGDTGSWNPIPTTGLASVTLRALGIDPTFPGTLTLYAGTNGRGVFRGTTPNNPNNLVWQKRNDGLTALRAQTVTTSAAPETVFAGLVSGGIIKSPDGLTWADTGEGDRTVRGIAVDPAAPTTAYAATGQGVLKSTDGGQQWTSKNAGLPVVDDPPTVPPTPRPVRTIVPDPVMPDVLYAAVGGVHTSDDGGETWTAINNGLPEGVTSGDGAVSAIVVDHGPNPVNDPIWGGLYAATSGSGVYRSTDGGMSWTAVNFNIDALDLTITALALDPFPPQTPSAHLRLYAGTSTGKVYKTFNGASWQSLSNGLPGNAITALVVGLGDPGTVYAAAGSAGVYVSTNEGTSWSPLNTGLPAISVTGLAFDPHEAGTLHATTLGLGLFSYQFGAVGAPIVFINSPEPGHVTESTPLPIAGIAQQGGSAVTKVLWFTSRGHAGQATGTTSWTGSVPLEPGPNVVWVTAIDGAANEWSSPITVTYTPPADTAPPTVDISTPTTSSTHSTTTTPLTIGGSASDNVGVTEVTWTSSRGDSGTASGTTSWTASVPLLQGSNVITVTAHDAAGNTATDVITVTFGTYTDVPVSHQFFGFIQALGAAGITGGCSTNPPQYCPDTSVTRGQMAVFLLRGIAYPGSANPPAPTGNVFADVPLGHQFAAWIEQLFDLGITSGCGTNPARYCPETSVTRGQMAVFLLKAKHGSGYTPPAPTQQTFGDVPLNHQFAAWIYQLAAEGITGGCGGGNYCPGSPVTRGQMAVFLVRTFGLPM
jgi:hypothetical protein